jgi:hypothetical protein
LIPDSYIRVVITACPLPSGMTCSTSVLAIHPCTASVTKSVSTRVKRFMCGV